MVCFFVTSAERFKFVGRLKHGVCLCFLESIFCERRWFDSVTFLSNFKVMVVKMRVCIYCMAYGGGWC